MWAGLAQLVEQGFCKPQVVGSNPIPSSILVWGRSSVGRAIGLQPIGRGFDPLRLHH